MQKEQILLKLKECGYRITRQRKILLEIILRGEYSSCKEIYIHAKKEDKKLGIATVYRMLRLLEEIGAISRISSFQLSFYQHEENALSFCHDEEDKAICVVELDDHTAHQFCTQNWYRVITEGLRACGYLDKQKIIHIRYILSPEMYT